MKAPPGVEQTGRGSAWQKAIAGFSYVRHNQLILGAMSLDLFAVLLGGVTALLPIFAQDILHVGPGRARHPAQRPDLRRAAGRHRA